MGSHVKSDYAHTLTQHTPLSSYTRGVCSYTHRLDFQQLRPFNSLPQPHHVTASHPSSGDNQPEAERGVRKNAGPRKIWPQRTQSSTYAPGFSTPSYLMLIVAQLLSSFLCCPRPHSRYADGSTLMAVVPSPGVRVTVAESLIRHLGRVSEWCGLGGMKLNASKTKTMTVSRSRTTHPQSPPLTIGGTVLKESDDLVILGVTFDFKMTFQKHLRLVSRVASQRLLKKSLQLFHYRSLLGRCFRFFFMLVFQYCSAVWCSAADTHLKLLDRAVSGAHFLTGGCV